MQHKLLAIGLLSLGLSLPDAHAGQIHLAWDPVPGAHGYRVYFGTESGQYTEHVDVGNVVQADLGDLEDCTTYFVAVKAYNASGESDRFSNEITGWARPTLGPATATAVQGSQILVEIEGANFPPQADLILEPTLPMGMAGDPLIVFESIDVVDCGRIQALVTVEPMARTFQAAPLGELPIGLEVRHDDGVFNEGTLALDVQFNPDRADLNRQYARTIDRVDGDDLASLTRSWGATAGDEGFAFDSDLDGDTDVDGEDLALLASMFGQCRQGGAWRAEGCS